MPSRLPCGLELWDPCKSSLWCVQELDLGGNELSQEGLSAVLDAVRCGGGTALEVQFHPAEPSLARLLISCQTFK